MVLPFQAADWEPSKPLDPWEKAPTHAELSSLIKQLHQANLDISAHPYDATKWIARARILAKLRYPELAVGDATKAAKLVRNVLGDLENERRPNFRIGFRMGFMMRDEGAADSGALDEEHERQEEAFALMQSDAEKLVAENLEYFPCDMAGRYTPVQYPWMRKEHMTRSDKLLHDINAEFGDAANGYSLGATCFVQRYAFGEGVGAQGGYDLLGVFAARDVSQDEVVLVDTSQVWGCNGPGRDGTASNLFGGSGCIDPLHPNTPEDDVALDLRWVRDRCGRAAANVLMKVRLLLCCIQSELEHPLDHSLAARLTPNYVKSKVKKFSLEKDISVPNEALQQFGVDIFANAAFDTWVLFTLSARIDNNSWSNPNTACVNGLFSLFNHSCEPNVEWASQDEHTTLVMTANRDIEAGEQMFVDYDRFMADKPLKERRDRFWRWLNGPCCCTRCLREEAELGGEKIGEDSANASFSSSSSWDVDEKPRLPEDEFARRDSLTSV